MNLTGKKIIVTGGGRGIGLAFSQAIVEAGGEVAILDILSEPHPDCQLLLKNEGKCHYFNCDITKRDSLEPTFAKAVNALGGTIYGCVTNAGIGTDKPFLEHTWDDFHKVVAVNQAGTFFVTQLVVRQLMSQEKSKQTGIRGSIVMIASAAASHACPGHLLTAYGGTKGFVMSFCRQLSHELAKTGIRVNSISPGYIATDMNLDLAKIRPEVEHYFKEAPPMKRMGQPTDLTGGLIYLMSDNASYVTGTNLTIDGGMSTGNGLQS